MRVRFQKRVSLSLRSGALFLLKGYKKYLSPLLPPACRFEPTCSVYMIQSIQKMGLIKGLYWGVRRIVRCHPFCEGGYDPVP
jgi:putative membrane protein insertion efficiency factor